MVAVFWLAAAQRQTYFGLHRVESQARLTVRTRPKADGCEFCIKSTLFNETRFYPASWPTSRLRSCVPS